MDTDHLSRWLWLVKWLLAIPHYVVLAFLWLAFVVLSIVAWVAILVTGRYPRPIFDFNVGVLRWTWRVSYYTYGGLGTDHYPPFTLEERPDYPAHLEVEYPDHLSRGLALVKWWLLAIPHYLVVAIFVGGGWYVASGGEVDGSSTWSSGLIGLLVLVAAVVLLFTGRYPRTIFDLVLGLNRWVLRVAAYASLMTDDYPPFRLDLGGTDPGTGVLALGQAPTEPPRSEASPDGPPAAGPPPATGTPTGPASAPPTRTPAGPPTAPPGSRWGAGRVITVVLGALLGLLALGMLVGGLVLRLGDNGLRDSDGYLMSSAVDYSSTGYAATTRDVDLGDSSTLADLPSRWLGTVKVEADSRSSAGVFVGIARSSDVASYLSGVAHSEVQDPLDSTGTPDTTELAGDATPPPPQQQTFWAASASGPGLQTLTWDATGGSWTLVVMDQRPAAPTAADVTVGATFPVLGDLGLVLLVVGAVAAVLAVVLLWLALRRRSAPAPA